MQDDTKEKGWFHEQGFEESEIVESKIPNHK
jgi:hypothetical protein